MRDMRFPQREARGIAVNGQFLGKSDEGIHASSSRAPHAASNRTLRQRLVIPTPPPYVEAKAIRDPKMLSLIQILLLILDVVWFVMIAHIIMSWLINFQVLNVRQPLVSQIWYGLNRLLEPIYAPIRRVLPTMGGLDLAPLVALIAVYALRIVLINNAYAFA
jgi:YggT family protein